MDYRIRGLSPAPFRHLYGLCDEELRARGVKRYIVDANPGFPDRVEVRDVEEGANVLLVNHVHQAGATPYRASHAIFIREGAEQACDCINAIPTVLQLRSLSVRAFSADHWMLDAELCEGSLVEPVVHRLLSNPEVAYLQVHFATRGCYAAHIDRA